MSDQMKICSKCGEEKPATTDFFCKNRKLLNAQCRVCTRAAGRAYAKQHRQQACERARKQRERNPDYMKQWRSEHKEEIKAYNATWADQHRVERNQYNANRYANNANGHADRARIKARYWKKHNPEQVRAQKNKRRANKLSRGGAFTAADIHLLFQSQHGNCWWCSEPLDAKKYHVDHRIPLSRGGSNAAENLCISCQKCNLSKGAKLPQEWNGRLL